MYPNEIQSAQFSKLILAVDQVLSPPLVEELVRKEQTQQQLQQINEERQRADAEHQRADEERQRAVCTGTSTVMRKGGR